jgi:hypothetical protein
MHRRFQVPLSPTRERGSLVRDVVVARKQNASDAKNV